MAILSHVNAGYKFEVLQNVEYKNVSLFSMECKPAGEVQTKRLASFRYQLLRARLSDCQSRLAEVHNLIKLKNPSLLLQLHQNSRSVAPTPRPKPSPFVRRQ